MKNRLFLWFSVLAILLYCLAHFYLKMTDGFSIARITSTFPEGLPAWDDSSRERSAELHTALEQTYHYLGAGGQCFAFVSEDKRYVIKFFKTRFCALGSLTLQTLPVFSQEKIKRKIDRALFKLRRDFGSYVIANRDLKEETGMIYLHLNKTTDLQKTLTIRDKIGICHSIDLDRYEFAVQRRAELAFSYLDELVRTGQVEQAERALLSLLAISRVRCQKGIHDEDAVIARNFGFFEDKPLFIDVGRFVEDCSRKDPCVYEKDLALLTLQLRTWIEKNHPKWKVLDEM